MLILFIVRIGILHTLILATLNYRDPLWGEDEAVLTSHGQTHYRDPTSLYRDPLWGEDEALLTSLGQTPTGMAKR